jgi:hypothetical protein
VPRPRGGARVAVQQVDQVGALGRVRDHQELADGAEQRRAQQEEESQEQEEGTEYRQRPPCPAR